MKYHTCVYDKVYDSRAMNILAIDCATDYLSLALQKGEKRTFVLEQVNNKQSNYILPRIKQLIADNDLHLADINYIAYNQGPGSFTGLRIGLSIAIGLAYGLDIPLIPIPGFAIFANTVSTKALVAIDARLDQVYIAGVNPDKSYFLEPQLLRPEQIPPINDSILLGNGFRVYRDRIHLALQNKVIDYNYPNALNILDLVATGVFPQVSNADADLLYLRNKVALNLTEQQHLKSKQ